LSPFLRKGLGFDPAEIGTMKKTIGTIAVLVGMVIGGVTMTRMRLSRALLFFGILQAGTNLVLYALAAAGKDYALFAAATLSDNLASGLGAVAFVAFLTGLCDTRFSATQYALLGSIAQLGRALVGAIAGPTADAVGWEGYFLISTTVAIPGLLLVVWLSRTLDDLDPRPGRQEAVG
jgi:PAT family beta-lactamase induction signal transducer AmpG